MARAAEVEAHAVAIDTMAAAGYDPQSAVRYLPRLPADKLARLKAGNAAIEKLQPRPWSANTGQFAAVKSLPANR